MTKFFIASTDTRNFTFEGYSTTATGAKRALAGGMKRHGKKHNLPDNWHKQYTANANVREVITGNAYRDGEIMR